MAPPGHVMKVDREDLYTNLESRIRYLHSFLDFNSNDIEALISGAKYIKALIPAVVNIVYRKLLRYDITARAFTTRSTALSGPGSPDGAAGEEALAEDSPQILHRKMFLRAYLARLCSDPSTMAFWEYLDKVGMMHVGLGRAHPLHIEYIHLGVCLGFIQDVMTEAVLSHPKLSLGRKTALVRALGKVIWIQNDLMAKWHIEDGEEFGVGRGAAGRGNLVIEKEGWVNGQKVLDEVEEPEDGGRTPREGSPVRESRIPRPRSGGGGSGAPGVCPFSGMAKEMGEGLKNDEVKEAQGEKQLS